MRVAVAIPRPWTFRVRSALSLPLAAVRRWPVVVCWLASRLVLLLFTALAAHSLAPAAMAHQWLHWDALWYVYLAQHGYPWPIATAFFPLYPLLIRTAAPAFGGDTLLAALTISNLAALLAAVGVARLARGLWPEHPARAVIAAALTLASPLALFLAAPYADSVLLAAVMWALVAARERRWWLVALCGLAAGLTRATGVLLALPFMWEFLAAHRDAAIPARAREAVAWALRLALRGGLAVGSPILGMAVYAGYLQVHFGDPLLFAHVEFDRWHHQAMWPWQSALLEARALLSTCTPVGLAKGTAPEFFAVRQLLDVVPVLVAAAVTLLAWRRIRLPAPLALFTLALVMAPIVVPLVPAAVYSAQAPTSMPWMSAGRYMLATVAVPLAIADWIEESRHPRMRAATLVLGGLALQLVLLAYFFQPEWRGYALV